MAALIVNGVTEHIDLRRFDPARLFCVSTVSCVLDTVHHNM
jgi:hypothetical protein